MTIRLGVVMDAIHTINYQKDSTLAMLFEAKARGFEIYYFEQAQLFLEDGIPYADAATLEVYQDSHAWFKLANKKRIALNQLHVILMRKDPPVDAAYIYTTYILEHAERLGVLVLNRPQALRDANEKLFATYFAHCMPKTLVTQDIEKLRAFWQAQGDIVCKPLNSMGGTSVFRLSAQEMNANVILETLTHHGKTLVMAQRYIDAIKKGDKRILMINGEPVSMLLNRVPQANDWRGNLAVGAKGSIEPLTPHDESICKIVGPVLKERGLYFVGLDVIGDYLTEINVTSPTGIRELDHALDGKVVKCLFDLIEKLL